MVWGVPYQPGAVCDGDDPHFYGHRYAKLRTATKPARLRLGVIYEVNGTASGSKYFGGAFKVVHDGSYRIEDMPVRSIDALLETNETP